MDNHQITTIVTFTINIKMIGISMDYNNGTALLNHLKCTIKEGSEQLDRNLVE
jgi:hypothetical protein